MKENTFHIGRKAGASILHSVRTAKTIGRPINTHVTINFWQLGGDATTIFRDFANLREKWFQRWSSYEPRDGILPRNGSPTYAYVHEATNDLAHTHWMVYIHPLNRERFVEKLEGWLLRRLQLDRLPENALHIVDAPNPEGLKKYIVKTLDPHFGNLWGIDTVNGGWIAKRRADTSRNLGPSVWKPLKAAYKETRY